MPLTIKRYLVLPSLLIVSIFAIAYLVYSGYSTLSHTYDDSRKIIEQQNVVQDAIAKMYSTSQNRTLTLFLMNKTDDDFELDELRQKMRHQADIFMSARNLIMAHADSPAELERYYPESLRAKLTEDAALQNLAADLFVEKKHDQAYQVMTEYSVPEQMDILSNIALMNTMLDGSIGTTIQRLDKDAARAKLNFQVLGSLTLAIFTFVIIAIIIRLLHGKHALDGRLKSREIQYKRIVDTVQDGIITMSENGTISSFNHGAEKLFACKAFNILGTNFKDFIVEGSHQSLDNYIASVLSDNATSGLGIVAKRSNNDIITLHISFSLTGLSGDQKLSGILRDITTQKKNEEELVKKSKLESIGVLAGGIAHDFNNILSGISGYTDLALHSLGDIQKTTHYLESSKKASQRAAGLTQQLLTFAKGGEPIKQHANIAEVIRESADFNLHGSNINCHYDIPDDLWIVSIDSGQISQVIHNLMINAKLAMPDGGDIHIRCQNTLDRFDNHIVKTTGPYIKISIQDTGPGIPDDIIHSIFDPYFTTRQEGSGLGLALSYSIINKHDGFIYAQSNKDGACFNIYLPASKDQNIAPNDVLIYENTKPERKCIMLMDDDEVIREVADTMLEEMGHQVICVPSGEEAIDRYKKSLLDKQPIDLIIMDLTIIGGMGGKEAIATIHSFSPQAKAIVSSGYSNDPVMANYSQYGFINAIAKPYNYDELLEAIENSLSLQSKH